jgi:benzoyl-CoA reductase/2-hydroxyglutaryl-CoA dehydratase subunit BcrC/BadD/HgdB
MSNDKLKQQTQERGIPILALGLEYGHPGAQMKPRVEAFLEMLESRV